MEIYFIVSGTETRVTCQPTDSLRSAVETAFKQTENEPRPKFPIDDWAVTSNDRNGWYKMDAPIGMQPITMNGEVISVFPIKEGDLLLLTIKAGFGG